VCEWWLNGIWATFGAWHPAGGIGPAGSTDDDISHTPLTTILLCN
jgi:hypothetical protein